MKKLIVLEGCDGSGKTSCALELAKKINGIYYKTPPMVFKDLKRLIEDTKDYNLRFHYYLTSTIYASLEIAKILNYNNVVCDRYIYSTLAYHRALGVQFSNDLENLVIKANYVFCLYAEKDELIKRILQRKNLGIFDDDIVLQAKILNEFKKFPLKFFNTTGLKVDESVYKLMLLINL